MTCLGVLDRGERGNDNETSWKDGRRNRNLNLQCFPYTRCTLSSFEILTSDIFLIFGDGNESNIVAAEGDLMEAMSSCVGNPVISIILSNWFMVDDPGKMGLPNNISPKMHPVQNSK